MGNIRVQEKTKQTVIFTVGSIKDLTNVIIPHFVNYPLLTKKTPDFELFKKVLDLVNNKEHLTEEGLRKIVSIRASMNKGLSSGLIESFPNITLPPLGGSPEGGRKTPNWKIREYRP